MKAMRWATITAFTTFVMGSLPAVLVPVHAQVPTLRVGWTIPAEPSKYLMMRRPDLFPDLGRSYQVHWTQFQGTSPMMQAMRANVLDCATSAPLSMSQAFIESGLKAWVVAQHAHVEDGYFSPYVAVRADSPIQTAADLKGKVVGTNVYGSALYYFMVMWLKQHGLEAEKEVRIVETGLPAAADAIRARRVDAATLVQPFALLAEDKGDIRPLFRLAEVQSPQVQIFEVCSQEVAGTNPEAIKAYVRDMQRALRHMRDDPDLAVTVTAEITRAPPALLKRYLFTQADFAYAVDLKPDLVSIQKTLDLYHDAGFLAQPLQISDFVRADLIAPVP